MQTDRAIFLTRPSSVFYITKNRASYIPQLSSNLVMTAGMEFYLQKVQLIWQLSDPFVVQLGWFAFFMLFIHYVGFIALAR